MKIAKMFKKSTPTIKSLGTMVIMSLAVEIVVSGVMKGIEYVSEKRAAAEAAKFEADAAMALAMAAGNAGMAAATAAAAETTAVANS